jgi:Alpha-L-arabinofuranosidase B, catalytic
MMRIRLASIIAALIGSITLALALGGLPGHNIGVAPQNGFAIGSGLWSTRLVNQAYLGNALTAKRASDSTTMVIGYIAGNLDTATLLAFCAATDCGVTVWNDQSGNGRDMACGGCSGATIGPLIVSSGVLAKTMNGHACIYNSPATEGLQAHANPYISTTAMSVLAAGHMVTGGATATARSGPALVSDFASNVWGFSFQSSVFSGAPVFVAYRLDSTAVYRYAAVSYTFDTDGIFGMRFSTGDTPTFKGYLNGGTPGTDASTNTNANASDEASVGANITNLNAWYCEVATYSTELSLASTNATGANMGAYWGPTWTNITQ